MMKTAKLILNNLERTICVCLLAVDLMLLTVQVIGRYVFNASPPWTEETARYIFIWLIFMGAGYTAQLGGHIVLDAINNLYPKTIRKIAYVMGLLVMIGFCLYMTYISFDYVLRLFEQNRVSMTTGLQMGWVYLAVPLGMLSVAIRTAQYQLLPFFIKSMRKEEETIDKKIEGGEIY